MITHLFYHQETVEEMCALNSWNSIKKWFGAEDEVIILDLGNSLKNNVAFKSTSKFLRFEKIRTDKPEERSYTYGLNKMIPLARFDWVIVWRSDYIYHKDYYQALLEGMKKAAIVLPYECFIGMDYCGGKWCKKKLKQLTTADDEILISHSVVCPVFETLDFPHFAIKKDLWIEANGMDERLFGYGYQFPELFIRLKKLSNYSESIQFRMIAFHQSHKGSFGLGVYDEKKRQELKESEEKLFEVFRTKENVEKFKYSSHQPPLKERRNASAYLLNRDFKSAQIKKYFIRICISPLNGWTNNLQRD